MAYQPLTADLTVLVPAAGMELLAFSDRPGPYQLLGDAFLLDVTLERLARALPDASFCVVVHPRDRWWLRSRSAARSRFQACKGGDTRLESVRAGLAGLRVRDDDPVLVHDVARPCVTGMEVHRLVAEACDREEGGVLATPVRDTVSQADASGRVLTTLDQGRVWRVLAPQIFPYGVLCRALDRVLERGLSVADEGACVEALGLQPRVVRGSDDNIRVLHKGDLALADWILRRQHRAGDSVA